jgi:hypothetical protein
MATWCVEVSLGSFFEERCERFEEIQRESGSRSAKHATSLLTRVMMRAIRAGVKTEFVSTRVNCISRVFIEVAHPRAASTLHSN